MIPDWLLMVARSVEVRRYRASVAVAVVVA